MAGRIMALGKGGEKKKFKKILLISLLSPFYFNQLSL